MDFQLMVRQVKAGKLSVAKAGKQMIAFVSKVADAATLKECKAQAAAIKEYLAQRKDQSVEDYNAAVAIRAKVDHRLGEVLAATVKRGRPKKSHNATFIPAELGNGKKSVSSRAQQLAAIPWKEIEVRIEQETEQNKKASQARIVKELLQEKRRNAQAKIIIKTDDSCRIIHGDTLIEIKGLSVSSARIIFADPPYNIGIDYGHGSKADQLPADEYMEWVSSWMCDAKTVLTDDGSLWVLIGDEFAAEYAVTLKQHGYQVRSWIKWYETFGVNCANNFNRCSRHLFYCVKNPKRFVFNAEAVNRPSDRQTKYNDGRADPGGKIWDNVWQIPRLVGTAKERIPDFPTQLPLALLTPIVGCASDPGDLVIDLFAGSGSMGAACLQLKRRFLGIEKSEEFVTMARQRLAQGAT